MEDEEKENADCVFAAKSLKDLLVLFDKGDHYRNLWEPVIIRLLKYKDEKKLNDRLDEYLYEASPDRKILRLLSTEDQLAKFVELTFRGDNKLDLQTLLDHEKITDEIKQEMYKSIRNAHQRYYIIRHITGDTDFWAALASNEDEKQIVAYATMQLQKFDPNFNKIDLVKRRILGMMKNEVYGSRRDLLEELLDQLKHDKEFIHSLIDPHGGFHHSNRSEVYPMISDITYLDKMLRREKSYRVRKVGLKRLKSLTTGSHLDLIIHIIKTDRTQDGLDHFIKQLGILTEFSPILVDKFLNPNTPPNAVTDLFEKFKYCKQSDPKEYQRILKGFCEVGTGPAHHSAAAELDKTPANAQYLLEMLQNAIESNRSVLKEELLELLDDAGRLKILEDYGDNLFRYYSNDKLKIILRRFTDEDLSNLTVLYTDSSFGKIARDVLRER
ncbi:hypothetical protein LCGC14_0195570 [marine sediment metagenome]|uniref:Uncharacterized protein n=1 Tax=marine sediment metagenome TaxID=412755 RepID=A0A0F9UQ04_9ZZZZ